MCQGGHQVVNYRASRLASNINNDGVPYNWILVYSHSLINIFYNHEILSEVKHAQEAIGIHCTSGVVQISITGVIPRVEQETIWYHTQGITNIIFLSLASNNLQMIYNNLDGNVFCQHKSYGSFHDFK